MMTDLDMILIKLILIFSLLSSAVWAETRYVTDQLSINLRTGESLKHRIIGRLPSGTAVEVLSSNPKTGYSRVRLENGKTGYVLTRYLLDEPVARERIIALEKRIQELESSPDELSSRFAQLSREHAALQEAYQNLKAEKELIEKELMTIKQVSANAVQIAEERRQLKRQITQMSKTVAVQAQEIRELKNDQQQNWFLIGAGVLFGGILLGLILPNLRIRRRRDSWGSL